MSYEGVLAVCKPPHFTSHDVVAKIRKIIGQKRVGHTGTLDPLVTGVLPICIGKATRIVEYLQDLPKQYEAELTFGYSTSTEDRSGTIVTQVPAESVFLDQTSIDRVFSQFIGISEQIPPMYSAVKINGKKMYELARSGIEIERTPRTVTIYDLQLTHFSSNESGYPVIRFRVTCSKGTYIRTLCVDIGKALGYPAVMSDLIRTKSAGITLKQCLSLEEIAAHHEHQILDKILIPSDVAVQHLNELILDHENSRKAVTGQQLFLSDVRFSKLNEVLRVYNETNQFLGIFKWDTQTNHLIPHKVWL